MKKIICVVLILAAALTLTACYGNRERGWDTKWNFEHAIIRLGNGELIEGKVDSWRDFLRLMLFKSQLAALPILHITPM